MIVLKIGTMVALLVGVWAAGFLCGALYKRRCRQKAAL